MHIMVPLNTQSYCHFHNILKSVYSICVQFQIQMQRDRWIHVLNIKIQENNKPDFCKYSLYEPKFLPQSFIHLDVFSTWWVFFNTEDGKTVKKDISDLNSVESVMLLSDVIYKNDKSGDNIRRIFEYNCIHCWPRPARVEWNNDIDFTGQ